VLATVGSVADLLQICCSSVAALFSVAHTFTVKAARGARVSSSMKEMELERDLQ
jgi:hypothetical protein